MSEAPQNVCEEGRFRQIFVKLGQSLRNFIYYKSGDVQQAEDISQEAFIRLWKACAKVQPDKAKAYLYRVANNLLLDQIKHEKVKLTYQQHADKKISDTHTPAYLLEEAEFREQLAKAIADLPEKSRTVFLMNRIDGLTYQEIADRLGISKKAVEKRMSKALVGLRQLIKSI